MEGVKQNERDHCRRRCICGGYSVLLYPDLGTGGQMEEGNAKERGKGCRQEWEITGILCIGRIGGMRRINQKNVSTVISGMGSGKAAARKSVIIFFRRMAKNRGRRREICQCRNPAKMGTAWDVHTAGIPHASVTACGRSCGK